MISGDEILDWVREEINELNMELNHNNPTENKRAQIERRKDELYQLLRDYKWQDS